MKRLPICLLAISLSLLLTQASAEARLFKSKKEGTSAQHVVKRQKSKKHKQAVPPPANRHSSPTATVTTTSAGALDSDTAAPTTPVVIAPSSLIDLTTAKFGRLDITLTDAFFLEARVRDLRLVAENMDMNKGTLESLSIQVDQGEFSEFTIDSLRMYTRGALQFDTQQLLNQKVLQFREPASARVRVGVSQQSLNTFLNAPTILERLSGTAKKRVPILSSLVRKDVNFGFSFTKGAVKLEPDNHVTLSIDSKFGMGKVGMPVSISADTKLNLVDGWVTLSTTKLHTAGHAVPPDLSERIVNRINSLSKWGNQSDDIKFIFTDLKVVPDEKLELEGTALIKRLRFARNQEPSPKTEPHGQTDVNESKELR